MVQTAVQQVWQQMREKTDADIEAIKNEAQSQVDTADERAQKAEKMLCDVKQEYDELQQVYLRQSAEKELLMLDIKSLREEHTLLRERHKALDERYTEMQSRTSQHLNDLSDAHKNEVLRLEEKCNLQEGHYLKLIEEIKILHEKELHQHMASLDALKVENQKQTKSVSGFENIIKNQAIQIVKLEANITALLNERDKTLNRLAEEDKKWRSLQDKTLVPDEILTKIYDMPKFDLIIDKINSDFIKSMDIKFFEFTDTIKSLKFEKQMEAQNE